jgi:Na+-translocating ferredoxin:NAD+ oxidoreductase RnfG subunit
MATITTDTLEGTINGAVSYHYDVFADVLYLRLIDQMETPSLGEETEDGLIELRTEQTNQLVGITIVSWWKRFGHGALPDSISEIQKRIEPLARRVAA